MSLGSSPDHGILAHAVGVFLRPDHVGNDLYQPVLGEGIIRPRHVHLRGNRYACAGNAPGVPGTAGPDLLLPNSGGSDALKPH